MSKAFKKTENIKNYCVKRRGKCYYIPDGCPCLSLFIDRMAKNKDKANTLIKVKKFNQIIQYMRDQTFVEKKSHVELLQNIPI